ncbi:hypothetical protein, partial [Vibrio vulnificus]|uniref:hypothetical protein n=1 Tax=Vibrio vulnificus TaxID=672 RepID=UPI0039B5656B
TPEGFPLWRSNFPPTTRTVRRLAVVELGSKGFIEIYVVTKGNYITFNKGIVVIKGKLQHRAGVRVVDLMQILDPFCQADFSCLID